MLEYFDLEYAITGDGEVAMTDFLQKYIESGQSPAGLKGLIIRRAGTIIQDNGPARILDLNAVPFPRPLHYLILTSIRGTGHLFIFKLKGVVLSDALTAHYKQN